MSDDIQVDPQSKLSALMDGEVDEFELRRTLDLIDQDPALRGKWRRYQLAASALRGEPLSWRDDLSERIAQAVASEPAPRRPVLVGILGRAAVAASVAVLTVAAVRYWLPFEEPTSTVVAEAAPERPAVLLSPSTVAQRPLGVPLPAVQTVAATGAVPVPAQGAGAAAQTFSPAEEERVRRYVESRMVRHADAAAARDGSLPLVRLPRTQEER